MSEKEIKTTHLEGKLSSFQLVEIDICKNSIFRKHKRFRFQTSGRTPKKERPELIHSNI